MLTNYPFDILAINETKLDSSISDSEIYIHGYTIIRKDRNRNGGGIAIYIKIIYPILKESI
jgi:exonuclease III